MIVFERKLTRNEAFPHLSHDKNQGVEQLGEFHRSLVLIPRGDFQRLRSVAPLESVDFTALLFGDVGH